MIDNWKPGDLALCVNPRSTILRCGAVYTVEGVTCPGRWRGGKYGVGLLLAGHPHPDNPEGDFWSGHFRKVTPPKADEFDREVIEALTHVGEPA